ncbi:unnamed protein product [Bemisia tabaci]|uniref:Salivary secreted peptide n=1 Tax=Bemisia tabaci TaxID=7038 RepID=A0A9P0EWI6_BEMTA|nr:unnamed protein product [Bemisia tabaci]
MLVLTALFCSALLLIDEPPPDKPKGTMLVGEHKKGDQVLFMMDIRKKATEGVILTQYVHYPPPNVFRNQTINLIAVLSNSKNFKGGYPTIISGGVGFTHVSIRLQSEKSGPIDYLVGVYGQ